MTIWINGTQYEPDITVADTTDTTCYVALFEDASGNLAAKTDGGLTYNATTGILTATGFSGPLNGTVGATTRASGAFTTLSASGDFSVATSKFTVASATGNTVVAGTLTVPNVELTAASGPYFRLFRPGWTPRFLVQTDGTDLSFQVQDAGAYGFVFQDSTGANCLAIDQTSRDATFGGAIKTTSPTGGIGYGTGAGGAVEQGTSRTTGVTLNKVCGAITLVSAAGDATNWTSFTLTNSAIAATDVVQVTQKSGTDLYDIDVTATVAGSCQITFRTKGGTTTEQPVFNFIVLKAVAA